MKRTKLTCCREVPTKKKGDGQTSACGREFSTMSEKRFECYRCVPRPRPWREMWNWGIRDKKHDPIKRRGVNHRVLMLKRKPAPALSGGTVIVTGKTA